MLSLTIKWFISDIWANSVDTQTLSVAPLTWGWEQKHETRERGALTTLQITEMPFQDPREDDLLSMKIPLFPTPPYMFSSATRGLFFMFADFVAKPPAHASFYPLFLGFSGFRNFDSCFLVGTWKWKATFCNFFSFW